MSLRSSHGQTALTRRLGKQGLTVNFDSYRSDYKTKLQNQTDFCPQRMQFDVNGHSNDSASAQKLQAQP